MKYREICERFIRDYYKVRCQQMLDGLNVETPDWIGEYVAEAPLNTPLGRLAVKIAKAANGDLAASQKTQAEVLEAIESLFGFLVTPGMPNLDRNRLIFFNSSDFGKMVRDAQFWARGDRLITKIDAANLVGVTVRAISQRIASGYLSLYIATDEPDPRKYQRVSFLEIKTFSDEFAERQARQLPSPDELVREYNACKSVTFASLVKKYGYSRPTLLKHMGKSSIPRRRAIVGRPRADGALR